jgi:drug/metabolite transporter (DMT)-like permease
MLSAALAFAFMGAFTHKAGESIDWRVVAFCRAALAFVFAATLTLHSGRQLVFVGNPTLWLRSITGSISLLLTFYAMTRLPIAEALSITNTFPLWVVLLSWPILGHIPSLANVLAAVLAVTGVFVMGSGSFDFARLNLHPAYLVAMTASFTSAVAMIGLHRLKQYAPSTIVAHFSAVGTVACLIAVLVPGGPTDPLAGMTLPLALCVLAVGATATIGQLCLTHAFTLGSPSKVSVVALSQVVFALVLDMLVWSRVPNAATLVGMLLIVLPTAWVMTHREET